MPKIKINDIDIYYELKGEGEPLVLIMGLSANIDWWPEQVVEELSKQYKILLFDNRGAGRSEAPTGQYSIDLFAKDTVDIMTALQIDRANIFGISMGGMIAQEIALNYPERVKKLILGCTNVGPLHSVSAAPEVLNKLINPSYESVEERINQTISILIPEEYIAQHKDKVDEFIKRLLIAPIKPEPFLCQLGAIMRFNSFDRLKQIKVPTLVLAGDQDVLIPPQNSEILVNNIPNARLEIFKGCGHGFLTQVQGELCDMLIEFIKLSN